MRPEGVDFAVMACSLDISCFITLLFTKTLMIYYKLKQRAHFSPKHLCLQTSNMVLLKGTSEFI